MVAHGFPMSDSSDDSADTVISVLESRLLSQDLTDPDSPLESSGSEENSESDEMGNRQGSEKKKKKDEPQEKKIEEKPKKKGKKSKGKSKRSSQNIESDFASTEGACASPSGTERPRSKSKRPDVLADLGQHSPGSPLGSPGSACGSQGTWSPDDESDVSTLGYSTPLLSTPQVQRYVLPKQSTPQQSSSERLEELGRSIEKTILDKLSDKPPGEGATASAESVSAPGPERKGRRNVKKKRALGQAVIDSDSFTLPLEDVKGGQTSSPSPNSKRLNVGTDKISLRASQESPVSPWLRDDDTPVDEEQMDEMFISCIDLSYNLADICSEKEFTEYGSLDSKKQSRSPKERSKDTSLSPRIARKPIVPMMAPLVPIIPVLKPVESRETPPKSDSSTSTLAEIGRDPASDAVDLDVTESAAACEESPPVSQDAVEIESKDTTPIASHQLHAALQECKEVPKNTSITSKGTKDSEKLQQTKKKQGKSKSKGKKKRNSKNYDDTKESDIPVKTSETDDVCSEVASTGASDSKVSDGTRLEVSDDLKEPVSDYDNGPPTVCEKEYKTDSATSDSKDSHSISDLTQSDKRVLTVQDSYGSEFDTDIPQKLETSQSHDSVKVNTSLELDTTITSEAAALEQHVHQSIDTTNMADRIGDTSTSMSKVTAKAEDTIQNVSKTPTDTSKPKFTDTTEGTGSSLTADVTATTEDTKSSRNATENEDNSSPPIKQMEEKSEDLSAVKSEVSGKESSSNLSPNEPASPKHVPPPSPSAMDALAEIDEDDEEAIEALEDNSQMKEVQLFGETVFKRLSSLVESQSQDEDLEERYKDFHNDEETDSPPVDLGSMTLLSDSIENDASTIDEEKYTESHTPKEVVEEFVVPGTVMSVEKSVTNISDSTDVLQLSNNDGVIEHGHVDEKEDVDDGTLKRKKKKSQKKNKKDKTKKGNVVKKPEIPAELKQAENTEEQKISHPEERKESKTEDESEKENTPPKRESQQIEEVIDAYGIVDQNVVKPTNECLEVDVGRPRFESDGSDDEDDSDSSLNTKSRYSELPSSSSIELTPRGIPEIEETFSELLSVKHILEDLEDRTPTEEVLPSFTGYDELRSPPELVNGRRSRMSPAVTDRTESDLDISEQRDDISTDSMYADDEDDGTEVLFSRSYSEPAGNEVVVSCTFYNTQHNNNTTMDDSDDFWEDYTTADESFKQIEISADAASSTFQNARKQMHDIHQHLQDLRRQMEHLQEEVESATLTPEYSMDSEDKRPITE